MTDNADQPAQDNERAGTDQVAGSDRERDGDGDTAMEDRQQLTSVTEKEQEQEQGAVQGRQAAETEKQPAGAASQVSATARTLFGRLRQQLHDIDVRMSLYVTLPDKYTDYIEQQARYARIGAYRRMTANFVIGYFVLLLPVLYFLDMSRMMSVVTFVVAAPFSLVLPYGLFSILAERRKRAIERVLPDALLLMSANIESGLTVEKAFLLSARDEFGPLADDIQRTAMKMFGGIPVEDALEELAEETNSGLFAETLKLLIDGINAGGEASALLESSAEDIRNSLHLREEIEANVKMYSIFILFASVLGAPLLFAISTYLAETTSDLWGENAGNLEDIPESGMMTMSAPDINVEFFRVFAVASILISNVFASLILSEIKNGSVKYGLKYVPVFPVIAIIIYFVADIIITSTLGGAM